MAEPTNPLFEEEKEFLERKKLEYERALRGDVEHLKEQTVNVGKLALIGAGAATGIWLLAKVFRGRKHDDARDGRDYLRDQNGRYDQGYGMAYDEQSNDPFFGYDDDDDERWIKHDSARFDDEADDNFDPHEAMAQGVRAYEQDRARDARRNMFSSGSQRGGSGGDEDDNGLSQYPNFPAHSARHHGDDTLDRPSEGFYFTDDDDFGYSEPAGRSADQADNPGYRSDNRASDNTPAPAASQRRPFYHSEHSHPTANLAPDNSLRLPAADGFQSLTSTPPPATVSPPAKSGTLGSMLLSFATSDTGRALLGQAAAAGLALLGKAVKDRMPQEPAAPASATAPAEMPRATDLAASTSPAARVGQPFSASDATSADLAASDFSAAGPAAGPDPR